MPRAVVLVILVCLMFAGAASAAQQSSIPGSSQVGRIQTIPVSTCSADIAQTPAGTGLIDISSTPSNAAIYLDGQQVQAVMTLQFGGAIGIPTYTPAAINATKGSHTVRISYYGYNDYSTTVPVCDRSVTYVKATLAATPTTTITTVPVTTTPVPGTTTLPVSAVTTVIQAESTTTQEVQMEAVTTVVETATQVPGSSVQSTPGQQNPASGGTLSVISTPAGASVYVDGVQRGVSPTKIPGLSPGSHTLLLKLGGYQDLTTPVAITAGETQEYTTGLVASAVGTNAPADPVTPLAKSPGFGLIASVLAIAAILMLRKQ